MPWHTGEAANECLKKLAMTPARFAVEMGTSTSNVYILLKRAEWMPKYLHRAASILGVNRRWLETGKGKRASSAELLSPTNPRIERLLLLYDEQQKAARLTLIGEIMTILREDLGASDDPPPEEGCHVARCASGSTRAPCRTTASV